MHVAICTTHHELALHLGPSRLELRHHYSRGGRLVKPSSSPTSPAESDVKNRASKLTPEKMAWFLERPEQMDLYIRFGSDACGRSREECEATLRRSRTDWLIFKPANELYPFTKEWNDPHHAGYYWHGVCRWRARKGINLTIPQWGRLLGEITKLTRAMTSAQAHLYIFNAIHNFELVQYRIGRIGEQLFVGAVGLGDSEVGGGAAGLVEVARGDGHDFGGGEALHGWDDFFDGDFGDAQDAPTDFVRHKGAPFWNKKVSARVPTRHA